MLFENEPDHRLFLLIGAIWEKTRRWTEKQLKTLNITFPQFAALTALSRKDRVTQRELSEVMDVDATTVMVVCDSLEKKNLIQRVPDPSDRRVNRIVLTDDGKEVFTKAYPQVRDGYLKVLDQAPTNELVTTVQLLEKLYRNASNLPEPGGN